MWLARDKDGELNLYVYKPEKFSTYWASGEVVNEVNFKHKSYPEVKWEDEEPTELIIKK